MRSRRRRLPTPPPASPPLVSSALLALGLGMGACSSDNKGESAKPAAKAQAGATTTVAGGATTTAVSGATTLVAAKPPQVPPTTEAPYDMPQMPPNNDAPQLPPSEQYAPHDGVAPQTNIDEDQQRKIYEESAFSPVRAAIEVRAAASPGANDPFANLQALAAAIGQTEGLLTSDLVQVDFYIKLSATAQSRLEAIYAALPAVSAEEKAYAAAINAAAAADKKVFTSLKALAKALATPEAGLAASLQKTQLYRLLTDGARTKAKDLIAIANGGKL